MKKFPLPLHALDVNLQLRAVLGHALPADFGFGTHIVFGSRFWSFGSGADCRRLVSQILDARPYPPMSTLATAMAAMPSSRPMKPISSLVVALMPMCEKLIFRASAMQSF